MGNTCCSNDALKEQRTFAAQVQLKKPRSIRDAKLSSPTNIDTAPSSRQYQQTPQTSSSWSLDQEYKKFLQKFREIRFKILQKTNEQKSLLSKNKWQESLSHFDKYYLTLSNRHELTNLLYKILKVEFCQPFTQKQIDEQFLEKIDEKDITEEIGYKLKSLKHKIQHRKTQALEYLKFLNQFSSYKTDFSDIKKIARKVHEFCQKDINAFSFITLYLINCINEQLKKKPSSIFEIIEKIKTILKELSNEYPPSSMEVQQEEDDSDKDLFNQPQKIDIKYQTCIKYPNINFTEKNSENKTQQIEDFIIRKAREAKKNKVTFQNILRPVCIKRGNHFQSALKIKSSSDEEILSIIRTLQKIVFKGNEQKCQRQFDKLKQEIIKQLSQDKQFNKLGNFCGIWAQNIDQVQRKILKGRAMIPFNVCDLLRGKAMFKSRSDIIKTFKDIQNAIQKLPKDKYSILQTQDRLLTPTKDFKILFQIDGTIAQLQLCKQMNKASNEFNHKIYELKRSKAFTPLFNLMIINERLSEIFITDLLQFLFFMIVFQEPQFINGKEQLQKFTQNYLAKNVKAFENYDREQKAQNRLFTKIKAKVQQEINQKLDEINQMLQLGYSIDGCYERDRIRKDNESSFMI